MKSLKALYFITITFCVSVLPKRTQQCSIQPATLSISTNQRGVFKCSCDDSIQPLPEVIIWLLSNSVVESVPIAQQQQLELTTSDDDVNTITSTLAFVIDSTSASVLNGTSVDCLALVINGDSSQNSITQSAELYVYGRLPAPSDVRVDFAKSKMFTQWTHPNRQAEIEPIAYHVNVTPISEDPIQSLVKIPGAYSQCISYEVCVMEETLAGIGDSACIQTSSNISVLGAFDVHVSNVSLLNHSNPSSDLTEMFIVGCSSEEMQVHMQGEFQDANVSVRNFTTSLELELPVPHTFTPSEHVTLGLKFLQPRVEDLLDVSTVKDGSTLHLQCVYAENSVVQGCLIAIECDDKPLAISITLSGDHTSYPLQVCALSCDSGTLSGYANNHGIVAKERSVVRSIDFEHCSSSLSSTPVPSSAFSPTAQGSSLITLFLLVPLMY